MTVSRAWLYVRGGETLRMVLDGTSLSVYGPDDRFSQLSFHESLDAMLHQAAAEQSLVLEGWSLEALTTERRSGIERRKRGAHSKRQLLQLVGQST